MSCLRSHQSPRSLWLPVFLLLPICCGWRAGTAGAEAKYELPGAVSRWATASRLIGRADPQERLGVGGTSVATPNWAGIVDLGVQWLRNQRPTAWRALRSESWDRTARRWR
jgi:hypothetical protein